ncbi:hypothetical protein IDH44_23295 [Paenibacillus sp. IB182496]|uniref:Uncharacterized protein n=1 Tax=Paenibacillus sabuli TaxID=2772509 RepID=A0A927BZ31_9BACL|nr:hypothetical protein [Paenibacillus sabuli]MBD2848134.1 hypothetical protein [Paenibacillus sabuli]
MIEERLDRIEGLITQLIQMVAENNTVVEKLEHRMDGMEQRMDGMERRMDGIDQGVETMEEKMSAEHALGERRHQEIMKEIRFSGHEIDYLRNQTAKHDMDIHVLKKM